MGRWIVLALVSLFWVLGTKNVVRAENPFAPQRARADVFSGVVACENRNLELNFDANQAAYTRWLTAPVPQPIPGAGIGGVGIGFEPSPDGKLIVRAILPGGPADKAGVKPGGRLVAIDSKSIDGMSGEQIRTALSGPIGSQVTITIETENEVMDVILNRAGISRGNAAPPPQDNPAPAPGNNRNDPAPVPPANNNARPAQGPFPAFIKPGTRIAYASGDSVIPNSPLPLQPDGKGNWFNTKGEQFTPGSGGVGVTALDIVDVTADTLAADIRNYMNIDVNTGEHAFVSSSGVLGNGNGLGDFWIPPARLREMRDGNENGVQIAHAPYSLNGKNYDAVSITTFSGQGYTRFVYDADSGLMIVSSSSHVQDRSNVISHAQLIEVRQRTLPWGNDALPDWMNANHQLDYQGVYNTIIPGVGENPWRYSISFALLNRHGNAVGAKQMTVLDQGNGMPPSQSQTERVFGAGGVGPLYISPTTLARLQPNTVLDEDRPTRSRMIFIGVQNNLAFVADQRGTETYQFGYDTNSGALSAIYLEKRQATGVVRVQLQLVNLR